MSDAGKIRFNPRCKRYYVDLKWQGKRERIYKYLGVVPCETEAIANRLLNDIRSEIDKGIFNPERYKKSKPLHLEAYSIHWLEQIEPVVSSATLHDYKNSLNNHIIPVIGHEFLPDLNFDKIRKLQTSIKREMKGKFNVMACLHKMLNDAHKSGYISQVPPFPGFKGGEAIIQPRINWIEQQDQAKIIEHIPAEDRPIFLFMMVTGCRTSEARAFRWQDIKHDSIVFEVTFGRVDDLKIVKGRKLRVQPKTEAVSEIIKMVEHTHPTWVFINPRTGKHYGRDFADIWRKAIAAAEVQHIRLYSATRHSFACQALNAGMDKSMVRVILGHSDERMTDKYAEWSQRSLKLAMDNVIKLPLVNRTSTNDVDRKQSKG